VLELISWTGFAVLIWAAARAFLSISAKGGEDDDSDSFTNGRGW
jgi:threonine/homoserine/homoserine lactone efflux protein